MCNVCIKIIEDSSESLGSFYTRGKLRGKHTGVVGFLGCLSFNINKIITSGGGGIILNNFMHAKIRFVLAIVMVCISISGKS